MHPKRILAHALLSTAFIAYDASAQNETSPPPYAEDKLGGPGESCQASRDCATGLACVSNVCRAPGYNYGVPQGPAPPPPTQMYDRPYTDWRIHDVHFFMGVNAAPGFGFGLDYATESTSSVVPAFLFSTRIGALFKETELALEFSPVTYFPSTEQSGILQMNLSIGSLRELSGDFYWPSRLGLGFAAVNVDDPLFTQRLDIIGVAYNWSHFLFELMLPSIRHGTDFQNGSIFSFHFGLQTSYVF